MTSKPNDEMASDGTTREETTFVDQLAEPARVELFASGARRRFPAGTSLFMQGDVAHEVLVVLEGQLKALVLATDGREVILDVVGPGSLLGEVAAVDGGDRSATVLSLTEVEVLVIPKAEFSRFLIANPEVLHDLVVMIAGRLRESDRRQLEFGTGDSLGRLCSRLIELADRYGSADANGLTQFESPLNQSDLAAWSGLSREAIVKSMRKLRDLGWIENHGASITLLDPEKVRHRASG
ncbi:MAG: CRP/FNR family cyclic AMP-dependent transcriptional regulator [Candidatus Poriferisodalaceae bacterium]|jgi:CRP/FNR family cyclic AMP-dependent transcriptional regulator